MRELADQLACDRSYITGIADQLEQRVLVDGVPAQDRRVKLLQLTEAGARARNRISEQSPNVPLCFGASTTTSAKHFDHSSKRCSTTSRRPNRAAPRP